MEEEMHLSIIKTGHQLECKYSHDSQLNCPLCPRFHTRYQKVIVRHLDNHIKAAVHFEDTLICRCNLPCRHTGHYHCPYCANTIVKKDDMFLHVTACQKKHEAENGPFPLFLFFPMSSQDTLAHPHSEPLIPTSACAVESVVRVDHSYTLSPSALPESPAVMQQSCQPSASPPEASGSPKAAASASEQSETTESVKETAGGSQQSEMTESVKETAGLTEQPETMESLEEAAGGTEYSSSRSLYLKSVKCPYCSLILYKRNLSVHIKRKHSKPKDNEATPCLESKGVRNNRCPFALPKGTGFCVPAGVQNKSQDSLHVKNCESEKLSQLQALSLQNLSHGLCEHVPSLERFSSTANEGPLKHEILKEMLKLGILKESVMSVCKMRQKAAEEARAPLSLLLEVGDLICFSVHEPKVCPFCCSGRVMVTYNRRENSFYCPFTKASRSCGHKNIARWHLFQTQKELFVNELGSTEIPVETLQPVCSPTAQTREIHLGKKKHTR